MPESFAARPYLNRRSSARGPLYVLVEARTHAEPMWAFDLSLSGVRCATRKPEWPGTYMDLTFVLPDTHERIVTGAQVMTLDTAANGELMLGLRFCRLADGAQMAIYRFLDRRSLWDPDAPAEENVLAARFPHLAAIFGCPAPFANLLAETYEALGLPMPGSDVCRS